MAAAAILDDRKSLSIAFLAISDQYATFIFWKLTDLAANLHLLSEPMIPLLDAVFLHTDQTLLLDLTQSYNDRIPMQEPVALVSPPPAFLSREGSATSYFPFISVIALHRMSTQVLHTVFGQEIFPSGAVDDAAPVPASFGRSHRWKRWDFGALRLNWSGPDRILRSMAKTAQVASSVICSRPVSGSYRSNRTNRQPVYAASGYY